MEVKNNIYSIVPSHAIIDLSMWINFFQPINPNKVMVMDIKNGDYFIV